MKDPMTAEDLDRAEAWFLSSPLFKEARPTLRRMLEDLRGRRQWEVVQQLTEQNQTLREKVGLSRTGPAIWCTEQDLRAARNEISYLRAQIATLFAAIEHGDEEHRAWLKQKLSQHFGSDVVTL